MSSISAILSFIRSVAINVKLVVSNSSKFSLYGQVNFFGFMLWIQINDVIHRPVSCCPTVPPLWMCGFCCFINPMSFIPYLPADNIAAEQVGDQIQIEEFPLYGTVQIGNIPYPYLIRGIGFMGGNGTLHGSRYASLMTGHAFFTQYAIEGRLRSNIFSLVSQRWNDFKRWQVLVFRLVDNVKFIFAVSTTMMNLSWGLHLSAGTSKSAAKVPSLQAFSRQLRIVCSEIPSSAAFLLIGSSLGGSTRRRTASRNSLLYCIVVRFPFFNSVPQKLLSSTDNYSNV